MFFAARDMLLEPTSYEVEPIWFTVPNLRSTFDLIRSCILTLLLCVWTAIHLNIPGYEARKQKGAFKWFRKLAKKLLWMLVGLVAPEVVLYIAWNQFIQARCLAMHLEKLAAVNKQALKWVLNTCLQWEEDYADNEKSNSDQTIIKEERARQLSSALEASIVSTKDSDVEVRLHILLP